VNVTILPARTIEANCIDAMTLYGLTDEEKLNAGKLSRYGLLLIAYDITITEEYVSHYRMYLLLPLPQIPLYILSFISFLYLPASSSPGMGIAL
jgi:hypothetical protein